MSLSNHIYFKASKIKNYLIENTSLEIFTILNEALITEKAYMAGGSILSCYSTPQFITHDLDIYINQSNFNNFIIKLNNIYRFSRYNRLASPYDNSFFKKNNILFRVVGHSFTRVNIPSIDIMVIPDEINIVDVLSNFDLTICEIWYNGKTINGTNLMGIKNKVGYLRKEYNDSLFKYLNNFIIKRIKKYRERGFKIEYDIPKTTNFSITSIKKNVTNPTEWVIKTIITLFANNIDIYKRYINKTNNYKSLLYPYNSLILKKNTDVKYLIFINSIDKFDNFELLLENLNKYFLIKNPKKFVNKLLKNLYLYLIYTNNIEYINYIDELTDLAETHEILSVFSKENNDGIFIMEKYIKNYNEDIIVESVNKSKYEKLKIKNENKCYDIILLDDIELTDYYKDDEIIFVLNEKFFCYTKKYLNEIVVNYLDNWFCQCNGTLDPITNNRALNSIDFDNIYIKISLDINIFILYKYIIFILNNDYTVYFLNFNKKITHSISFKNTNSTTSNWVGANHCQNGSEINIYTIKYCDIK